jgi:hypothetical protein
MNGENPKPATCGRCGAPAYSDAFGDSTFDPPICSNCAEKGGREYERSEAIRELSELASTAWRWARIVVREALYVAGMGYALYFFLVVFGNIESPAGLQLFQSCLGLSVAGRIGYALGKFRGLAYGNEPFFGPHANDSGKR